MTHKFTIPAVLAAAVALTAQADILSDANDLFNSGDWQGARSLLLQDMADNPKAPAAAYSYIIGRCELNLGDIKSARSRLEFAHSKGVTDALLPLAEIAFSDYEFTKASSLLNSYSAAKRKVKQIPDPKAESLADDIRLGQEYIERVENIVVIDSISVEKDDFFKSYRLPSSAGWVTDSSILPFEAMRDDVEMVFSNENGDYLMWSQPDSFDAMHIMESSLLTDGTWSTPSRVEIEIPEGAQSRYPFMLADGVSLYFAADGEGSLGGYDIFIANRDPATGKYMAPKNLGMPYNSPFNDYLMAIDEENGVGWWATDRNRLDGKVTIYTFIVNELRNNYPVDTEDIASLALISDYKATWRPGENYTPLLATIAEIEPGLESTEEDFHFPAPGGIVYRTLDDFPSEGSRKMMEKYLAEKERFDADAARLDSLRRQYHKAPAPSLETEIISLEKMLTHRRSQLAATRSDVYRELKNY